MGTWVSGCVWVDVWVCGCGWVGGWVGGCGWWVVGGWVVGSVGGAGCVCVAAQPISLSVLGVRCVASEVWDGVNTGATARAADVYLPTGLCMCAT